MQFRLDPERSSIGQKCATDTPFIALKQAEHIFSVSVSFAMANSPLQPSTAQDVGVCIVPCLALPAAKPLQHDCV